MKEFMWLDDYFEKELEAFHKTFRDGIITSIERIREKK